MFEEFGDLDAFVELPRPAGLWLSPDGGRLVTGVAVPDHDAHRFRTGLWDVDPHGARPARPLDPGGVAGDIAGTVAFTSRGDLLFVSDAPEPSLWLRPAGGGAPRAVARLPAGARGLVAGGETAVVGAAMLPGSRDVRQDEQARAARERAGVSALLHEEFPVRHWDHDLGPGRTRLLAVDLGAARDGPVPPTDLTGHVGRALGDECTWDITPDGRTVVSLWAVAEPGGAQRHTLVAIDAGTGRRRTLADEPGHEYGSPRVSPDGTHVVFLRRTRYTPADPGDVCLGVAPLTGGAPRAVAAGGDRWPREPRWSPDGGAVVVAADDHGRAPLWRVDLATGDAARLTGDHGAYTDPCVSPDGRWVYALRSAVDGPPAPVRVPLGGAPVAEPLPGPADALGVRVRLPGFLAEVTAAGDDGTPLRAWLAVPHGAGAGSPAPLLVQVHGGPLASGNTWSWRWNPWVPVARGYAVLLPDYALSTGYGLDFVRRGWAAFGDAPYTDILALTGAAQGRPDIDADRAAVAGASFGGYLANWIAGHTGRFAAIVTHASIWDLDRSADTADTAHLMRRQRSRDTARRYSPHRFADAVTTPMLVVHGDRDHRVPVGEALHLWRDLSSRSAVPGGPAPHKFLLFPGEGHFIGKPGNIKACYATVLAFLDHHVRGAPWRRPAVLS
ncbi:dipeptidyl aminopeptidase/acylaminoacyl peptidase [Prauserella shujinwangii]|uniref:Dipeptidyl aminopeptidase/acylaminoacyl peptidase n=1 Tax=Prauserella shujinwangii TaxID=1453103 RepID=A0A2T0LPL3_9PSEU|nr:prolyl oligopeptidase family serine peptidase [Prauserella shujinwangii]PRX45173.1 dipeptidyl aminopeptidase/acylaminoacyl peptidase [Prauserella shujinwangii]